MISKKLRKRWKRMNQLRKYTSNNKKAEKAKTIKYKTSFGEVYFLDS